MRRPVARLERDPGLGPDDQGVVIALKVQGAHLVAEVVDEIVAAGGLWLNHQSMTEAALPGQVARRELQHPPRFADRLVVLVAGVVADVVAQFAHCQPHAGGAAGVGEHWR